MTSSYWECTTHCPSPFFSLNLFAWAHNSNQIKQNKSLPERAPQRFSPTNAYLSPEPLSSIWVLWIYWHRFDFLGHMCLKFFNSATIFLLDDSLAFVHAGNPILSTELQYHHCLPLPLSCPVRPLSPLPCFFPVDCCFFKFLCKDTRLKDTFYVSPSTTFTSSVNQKMEWER